MHSKIEICVLEIITKVAIVIQNDSLKYIEIMINFQPFLRQYMRQYIRQYMRQYMTKWTCSNLSNSSSYACYTLCSGPTHRRSGPGLLLAAQLTSNHPTRMSPFATAITLLILAF